MLSPWAQMGGTERHVATLAGGLAARGWRVTIVGPAGPAQRWWSVAGAQVRMATVTGRTWWRRVRALGQLAGDWIQAVEAEGSPALIHVHGAPEYLLYLSLAGLLRPRGPMRQPMPVVYTSHGFAGSMVGWDYQWAAWAARRWADAVIAVSRAEGERLVRAGLPRPRLTIVHNAVPVPVQGRPTEPRTHTGELVVAGQPRPSRPRQPSEGVPFTLGFVGRLSPEKGLSVLLEAIRRWQAQPQRKGRGARLLIVGDGVERPALEDQAAAVERACPEVTIEFIGRADPAPYWSQMDLVAVPSLVDANPIVVLEAMAAGRPVVASDLPGILEILDHEQTGWVVRAGDAGAWARALAQLADDSLMLERIGEKARRRVEKQFAAEGMAADTENVYWEVMAKRGLLAQTSSS